MTSPEESLTDTASQASGRIDTDKASQAWKVSMMPVTPVELREDCWLQKDLRRIPGLRK